MNNVMEYLERLSIALTVEEKNILKILCKDILEQHSPDIFLKELRNKLQVRDARCRQLSRDIEELRRYAVDHNKKLLAAIIAFTAIATMAIVSAIAVVVMTPFLPNLLLPLIITIIGFNLWFGGPWFCTGIRCAYLYLNDIKDLLENKQKVKYWESELTTEAIYSRVLKKLESEMEHTDINTSIAGAALTSQVVLEESAASPGITSSEWLKGSHPIHPFSMFKPEQPVAVIDPSLGAALAL